jgi:EAL domain-containing protein (putative c-di-GMP-specific phosphodiesterase class I)
MSADETKAGSERAFDALNASGSDQAERNSVDADMQDVRARLDEALRGTWVELWYQPKIDIKRRCLAGAEAMARVRHPEQGVLLPEGIWKEASEEAVFRLTEHALLMAFRDWGAFDEAGFNLRLAINIPVNLLDKLPISTIVAEYGPKVEHWPGLIVEVSEDQIVRDITRSKEIAATLRASGISVAIDDFGAGYSSFSSLRELAFTELKLNRSFVNGCAGDATNAAICQTAIDLAHRFGSAAVAEGIETVADLQAMQIMGCDFAQGPLIAPALPAQEFIALLRQRMNRPHSPQRPSPQADAAVAAGA